MKNTKTMSSRAKTKFAVTSDTSYGFVDGEAHAFSYRRPTSAAHKRTELRIRKGDVSLSFNGTQVRQLKKLLAVVG